MSIRASMHHEKQHYRKLAEECLSSLRESNVLGHYFSRREQALAQVISMIPPQATITHDGSGVLEQVGIIEALEARGNNPIIQSPMKPQEGKVSGMVPEPLDTMNMAEDTGLFLAGLDAITLDGKIVIKDNISNQSGYFLFGAKKVIAVAGINCIVTNIENALKRIRKRGIVTSQARRQTRRGTYTPPCANRGACINCRHPRRIACYALTIKYQSHPRIELVLVGEKLGIKSG